AARTGRARHNYPYRLSVAEAIVAVLEDEQVPFVAGIPGGGVVELLDVMSSAGSPRYVLVRHEQVAVHMALGYAELTARPAVVLVSRAPGASNTVIGVQAAWAEGSPLVLISSHVSSKARGLGAFQEIDLESLFRPITKMSVEVRAPERVTGTLQEAFRVATEGRPGPVHVSVPLDFPAIEVAFALSRPSREVHGRLEPSPAGLERAVALLAACDRPVIIAGGGVTKSGAAEAVLELAEELGAAVTNTWEKKAVREDYPLATGGIGRGGSGASAAVLHEADLVLALGTRFSEPATEDYAMAFEAGQSLVQVDIDAATVGRVYPAEVGIAADARAAVLAILERLRGRRDRKLRTAWRERVAELVKGWQEEIYAVDFDAHPISSPRVVRDLRRVMAPDGVLCSDSGNFNYFLARYFTATSPGIFLYPAATGPMGCALPAAMGVKVAFPDRQVVAVAGDGGFAMTMQDLETCVRERIAVVALVMNNFAYGNIKLRQQVHFGNRLIGCELSNPDFAEVARLVGARGETVRDPDELVPSLQRALSAHEPFVLDVHVDPDEMSSATVDPWW
ncbi:MAG: thiamine pyrophosphate-binding protein, partial [Actinomycetota bacterium]|nr:thiamine pyrophosphate-binding protein [Actinomycetota bacterium]